MGPKKQSGSAFRKIRKHREKTAVALSGQLKNWLANNEGDINDVTQFKDKSNTTKDIADFAENDSSKPSTSFCSTHMGNVPTFEDDELKEDRISMSSPGKNISVDETMQSSGEDCSIEINQIVYDDPKKWPGVPEISDKVRLLLIKCGPQRVDVSTFKFPDSDGHGNRHLDAKWFYKILTNGERVLRQWLLYSQSEDALFCFPCLLFGKDQHRKTSFSDINKGFKDWKHLNPLIYTHENSSSHRLCCIEWKDLQNHLRLGKTVDAVSQENLQKEIEKWRSIVKVMMDVILFCAKNNLAIRGTAKKEVIGEPGSGVFLSTLELISHYHPQLAAHMSYVKSKKQALSYFSPRIQNEVISLIGGKVKQEILNKITAAKYFSIIFDCTPDSAHIEQISQVIRFVDLSDGRCQVSESFIDFISTNEHTGKGLSNDILKKLNEDGLSIGNCRGQGYDNGSNMAGKYIGVQAQILTLNNQARYVPCAAHSLNLIGAHAAAASPLVITFFGIIQKLFTFFSGSTGRWQALLSNLDITLKGHCNTRWSTKRRAVSALKRTLTEVFSSLNEMARHEKWNLETRVGAQAIIKQIDYKFLCLLQLWERILVSIDKISKALQKETVSIDKACKMIKGLTKTIQAIRDEGLEPAIEYATQKAKEIGIDSNFPQKRCKKVSTKELDLESRHDNTSFLTPHDEFRREVNVVFDRILSELKTRYEGMSSISSDFYFLTGPALRNQSLNDLTKCATDFGLKYSNDVDVVELCNEIETFKMQAEELLGDLEKATPLDLLQKIQEFNLSDIYPNIQIALRIYLTLPVTVASCERSFSKLKLIKNYLRSKMGQERLTKLAIISIEHEEVKKLNLEDMVNDFASMKARKVAFK